MYGEKERERWVGRDPTNAHTELRSELLARAEKRFVSQVHDDSLAALRGSDSAQAPTDPDHGQRLR